MAQSLTKSSASLVAAGGNLAEAAALTATANAIIQDADSVGTALKTTSLRLRGTSVKVLEEEGLDSDGAIESTSKLRSQVLATSGVDILTDTGAYKSTYQILLEIAEVWDQITDDKARAGLLELLAGKRNSSVIAALLQNPEDLKAAYEDAMDAEGSALKENEKYLDSIQGKMDQFNNAVQSLWQNLLGSDVIKNVIDWGTKLIKSLDTTEGKILAIVKAVALLMAYKKINPFDWAQDISGFFAVFNGQGFKGSISIVWQYLKTLLGIAPAMKVVTAETVANTIATQVNDAAKTKEILTSAGLTGATGALSAAQRQQAADAILAAINAGTLSVAQGQAALATLGFATAVNTADGSIKVLDTTTKSFMTTNPVGWILLVVSAVMTLVMWLSNSESAIDKLGSELSTLKSELANTKSEIDALNSELETTEDRMAELLAMPSLSFVEQEELNTLKQTTAELERQLKLKEMLVDSKEDAIVATSEKYIDKVWNSKGADKAYTIGANGTIKEDGFWSVGEDTKTVLNRAMAQYQTQQDVANTMAEALSNWDSLSDYDRYALTVKAKPDIAGDLVSEDKWIKAAHFNQLASKKDAEKYLEDAKDNMKSISESINMVFTDENFDSLEYGMSDEINAFLDEMYAYQLKWRQAQGEYVKSDAISSMFDATSTKEMQEFSKALREIADGDGTDAENTAAILENLDKIDGVVGDGIKKVDGATDAYNRLFLAMDIVGVTAQDIADYFVLTSGVFNSNTIEGIASQYQHMENVINVLKNMSSDKFTFDGIEYNWDEFFSQDDQGKFKANAAKFSEILVGIDNDAREAFIGIVESAANSAGDLSQIDWNQALTKLDFSGLDRTVELLNNEFEGLNNEMFAGAADDINGLIDTVSELQAALEDVASTMDLLSMAQEQMSNSGQISVKTALDLMSATDDYNKVVTIENGVLQLATGAQDYLTQAKFNSIKTQLEASATLAETTYQTALASQSELDYADNASIVMTAESIKAEAIGRVSAVIVALGAAMDAIQRKEYGSIFSSFSSTYQSATATVVAQSNAMKTSIAELERDAKNKRSLADVYSFSDDYESFKDNYDFDKTPGDKYDDDSDEDDRFQREMEYWENRIGANQARYEQLQNEIDLLEAKGQKADASYHEEQIEIEQQRLSLLQQQKAEAQSFLGTFTEGSEEWFRKKPAYWETNRRNPLNCWNFLRALYTTTQG